MGLFGKKRPAIMDFTSAVNPPPNPMRDPLASLGGYDRNAAMQGQSGFAPMNQGFTPPEQKKPGFFSKGGAWLDVLGAFGDGFGTNGPVYAQQKAQQNRLMQQAQMAEQQRQADREDFIWKSQYERDNPKPINNDTANDYAFWKGKLDAKEITPEQFHDRVFPARYVMDQATGQQIKIGGIAYTPAPAGVTFTPLEEGGPVQKAPVTFR